ncbi:hypothetical protein MAR_017874, partial [Mya arenaria]
VPTNSTADHYSNHREHGIPHNQSNLRLLTVNCCSVRANRSEFNAALEYIKPDLICGTESWLKGVKPGKDPDKITIKSSEIFPPELTVHRNDRSSGVGGGVFTATRGNLTMEAQPQLSTDCEIVWSKMKTWKSKDLYLCSFFIPHRNINDIRKLDESLRQLTTLAREKHIILAGDFNCPDIDWSNMVDNKGISDHAMVVTDINIIPQYIKQKPRKTFLYSKANWENIQKDMEDLSKAVIDEAVKKPFTALAQQRLEENDKAEVQWGLFKQYQRECKKAFKKAEVNHINNTIQKGLEKNNSKPFWRYVNSRRQDSVGVEPLKKAGRLVNNGKEKSQILVDQFKSVFTRDESNPQLDTSKISKSHILPLTITTKGFEKLLTGINTSKVLGPDKISNLVLKTCTKQIAPALSTIFQFSVDTGTLPSDWRNAHISAVFKKGDVHLAENHRPVSLTCISC